MADTTTNYGWTIPTENSNPYYAAFLSLMNEVDAEIFGLTFTSFSDTPVGYTTNGALYVANNTGSSIDESTVILTEAANTFAITKGTASLDIAAGSALDVNANLTVESTSVVNQDLTTDTSPTFTGLIFASGGSLATTLNGDLTLAPHGTGITYLNSGLRVKSTTVSAATYSTVLGDYLVNVTYTATAPVTITIDSDNVVAGMLLVILDGGGNASLNNITINTEGSETISGETSWTIDDDYNSVTLWSDGSNWFII